jgi:hypothetical protein
MVKLDVGDRARRTADWLPVHPDDEAQQRLGPRVVMKKLIPLRIERGPMDLHQAGVVGAAVAGQLAEPTGVDRALFLFVLDLSVGYSAHTLDGRMVLDVHALSSRNCGSET